MPSVYPAAKLDRCTGWICATKPINAINGSRAVPIFVRKIKYLNNIIEQDHCAIKRLRPMPNFKSFCAAGSVLASIELIHMIRKGQFKIAARIRRHSQINFLDWQEWSVQSELVSV